MTITLPNIGPVDVSTAADIRLALACYEASIARAKRAAHVERLDAYKNGGLVIDTEGRIIVDPREEGWAVNG